MNKPSTPPEKSLRHEPRRVTLVIDDPRTDWIPDREIEVPERLAPGILALVRDMLDDMAGPTPTCG